MRENLEKIDFNDNLDDNARLSLAEYYEHMDFDEGFNLSQGETENPFGEVVKENEDEILSFNEQKNLDKFNIGKMKEEEISSIPQNEKNLDMINLNMNNINNNKTPSFHLENENNNIKNYDEIDLNSDIRIINNLNSKFNEKKIQRLNKFADENGNIDINEEIENDSDSNNQKTNLIKDKKENIKEVNIENNNTIDKNINNKNDNIDKEQKFENKNIDNEPKIENNNKTENKKDEPIINIQDNQTLYYGILGILGLFCLKSLFSSNSIFSADSFLNVIILGVISFVFYKTQFQ